MTEILLEKSTYYDEIKQSIVIVLRQNEGIKKIEKNQYDEAKAYDNVILEFGNIPSIYIEKSVRMKNSLISNLGYISEICLLLGKNELYIKSSDAYGITVIFGLLGLGRHNICVIASRNALIELTGWQ